MDKEIVLILLSFLQKHVKGKEKFVSVAIF